jgi:two-component sensor histidine kinase
MLSIHELTTNPLKHVFLNNQRGERRIGYNSNSANESYTLDYRDNTVGIPDHVDLTHPEPFGMSRLFDLSKKVKETVTRIKESDTHYVISLPS